MQILKIAPGVKNQAVFSQTNPEMCKKYEYLPNLNVNRNNHFDKVAFGTNFGRFSGGTEAENLYSLWVHTFETLEAKLFGNGYSYEDDFFKALQSLAHHIKKTTQEGKNEKAKELFFSHKFGQESVMTFLAKCKNEVIQDFFKVAEGSDENVKKAVLSNKFANVPFYDLCLDIDNYSAAEGYLSLLDTVKDKKFVYETLTKSDEEGKNLLFKTADKKANSLANKILDIIFDSGLDNQKKYFRQDGLNDFKALLENGFNSLFMNFYEKMVGKAPDLALKVNFPEVMTQDYGFINVVRTIAKSEALTKEETIAWLNKYQTSEEVPEIIQLVKKHCKNINPADSKKVLAENNHVSFNELTLDQDITPRKTDKTFIIEELNKRPYAISRDEINRIINDLVRKHGRNGSRNISTHLSALMELGELKKKTTTPYQKRAYEAAYDILDNWINNVE
ncbi:MAG: hypothetical protein WCY19_03320 [Candidatus Gastranaerophilaceae bacterium]